MDEELKSKNLLKNILPMWKSDEMWWIGNFYEGI